jgi:hypothetical protein
VPAGTSADGFRIIVREEITEGAATRVAYESVDMQPGQTIHVGREAELRLGADPVDPGVSRTALTVTSGERAWEVRFGNRNGANLVPWAQAPTWITGDTTRSLRWPRVAIRVAGHERGLAHWVLLESDVYRLPSWADDVLSATDTRAVPRPRELTAVQLAAVYAIFPNHLAWPPSADPVPRSLEAAAKRLGITPSAVRERLKPVQERARELGMRRQVGVTEPDYVYHLATHGYLTQVPPPAAIPA